MPIPPALLPQVQPPSELQNEARPEPGPVTAPEELAPLSPSPNWNTTVLSALIPAVSADQRIVDYEPYMTAFDTLGTKAEAALAHFTGDEAFVRFKRLRVGAEKKAEAAGQPAEEGGKKFDWDAVSLRSALTEAKTELGKLGITFDLSPYDWREQAHALARSQLGDYEARLGPEQAAKVLQAAYLTVGLNQGEVNSGVVNKFRGVKWEKMEAQFKARSPDQTGQQWDADVQYLRAFADGWDVSDTPATRGKAQRWFAAMQGKPWDPSTPDDVLFAGIKQLIQTSDQLDKKLAGWSKWAQLGLAPRLEEMPEDGQIMLGQVPLYGSLWTKDLVMQSRRVGHDLARTAEYNVRQDDLNRLGPDSELYIREHFGELQTKAPRLYQHLLDEMGKYRDSKPEDRMAALGRLMEPLYLENKWGYAESNRRAALAAERAPVPSPEYLKALGLPPDWKRPQHIDLRAMWSSKVQERVNKDIKRQMDTPVADVFTPGEQEAARKVWLEVGEKSRRAVAAAEEAQSSNWLWNRAMQVVNAVGSVLETTGVPGLLRVVPETVFETSFAEEAAGAGLRGVPSGVPSGWVEYFHQIYRPKLMTGQELLQDFYDRKQAGKASWLEEFTLLPYLATDMVHSLAGFALDDPGTFMLLGKGVGGFLKTRSVAGDAMVRAGIPHSVVAGMEMAVAPAHIMLPFKRLMGDVTIAAGKTMQGIRKSLNQNDPQGFQKGMNYIYSVLDHANKMYGSGPEKVEALRSAAARIEAEVKLNGSLSRRGAARFGEELRGADGQLIQALTEPFNKVRSTLNPFAAQNEMRQLYQTLAQLDDAARDSGVYTELRSTPAVLLAEFWKYRSQQRAVQFEVFANRWRPFVGNRALNWLRPFHDAMIKMDQLLPALGEDVPAAIAATNERKGMFRAGVASRQQTYQRLLSERDELLASDIQLRRTEAPFMTEDPVRDQRRARIAQLNEGLPALAQEISQLTNQLKTRTTTAPGERGAYDGFQSVLPKWLQAEILHDTFYYTKHGAWDGTPRGALALPRTEGQQAAYNEIIRKAEEGHGEALPALLAEKALVDEATHQLLSGDVEGARHTLKLKAPTRPKSPKERYNELRKELEELDPADPRRPELQQLVNEAYDTTVAVPQGVPGKKVKVGYPAEIRPYLVDEYVEAEIGRRREAADLALDKLVRKTRDTFIREALNQKLLDIEPLADAYRKRLDEMRKFNRWLETQATAPGGAAISLSGIMTEVFRSVGWRTLSDLDFRVETGWGLHKERLLKLEEQYHKWDPKLQEMWRRHQLGEEVPGIDQEVLTASVELTNIRQQVLQAAHRVGAIDTPTYEMLRGKSYEERVYLKELEGKRMAGLAPNEPFGMARSATLVSASERPRFDHLKPQHSTRYARQLYWSPKDGKVLEEFFYLDKHGGADGAMKAAAEWREKKLKSGELREEHLSEIIAPITDEMLGARGWIDNMGLVRFHNLRKLMSEAAAYDTFGVVSRMLGLARDSLEGIPQARIGEWSKKLEGKDWGPLEGKHVHRNVVHMIRSWDDLHAILGTAAESLTKLIDNQNDWVSATLFGKEQPSRLARALRTHLILANAKSWVNNFFGGFWSAYIAGANPLSREWLYDYFVDYNKMTKELAGGQIGPNHPYFEHTRMLGATGNLAQTAGIGGSSSLAKANLELQAGNTRLLAELGHYEKMEAELARQIADGVFEKKPTLLKDAQQTLTQLGLIRRSVTQELVQRNVLGSTPMSKALSFTMHPQYNVTWATIGDAFGSIDSRSRWATYKALLRQGASHEAAAGRLGMFFQNYAQVPNFIRQLRNRPIVGAMVPSFAWEASRIMANAWQASRGRFLTYALARPLFNLGSLAAAGLSPKDYMEARGFDNQFEQIANFISTAIIPTTDGGLTTIDLGGIDPASVLYRPAGPLGAFNQKQLLPVMEGAIGPLAVVPAMLVNLASQFVGNTPVSGMLMTAATGVDTHTGELVSTKQGSPEFFGHLLKQAAGLITPRTAWALYEAGTETGPTSMYTGGYNTALEQIVSKTFMSIRNRSARELVVASIIQRLHEGERADLYNMYVGDNRELVSISQKFMGAQTLKDREAWKQKGMELIKAGAEKPLTDAEAMQRFVTWAGRNAYQLIDRMPIEKLPGLVHWLRSAKYGPQAKDLESYARLQLVYEPYLSSRNDLDQLLKATVECARLGAAAATPEERAEWGAAASAMVKRIQALANRTPQPLKDRLVRMRLGNAPRALQLELERVLGATSNTQPQL